MKVGFVGLGKLGLPVSLAMEKYGGHEIYGYDISPEVVKNIRNHVWPHKEEKVPELLEQTKIHLCESIGEVVSQCAEIFCAPATPHDPEYEGSTRVPTDSDGKYILKDFSYTHLIDAVTSIAIAAKEQKKHITLVVISTVLPGTMQREIKPILSFYGSYCRLIYNPYFIAMGTVIEDFLNPEFVLVGCDDEPRMDEYPPLHTFYGRIVGINSLIWHCSIKEAELVKVIYNTYISSKIVLANTIMEISHKIGTDTDVVTGALLCADKRIISGAYMKGGMGDGGACHPRDLIAMAWLGHRLELEYNAFEYLVTARENQTEFLVKLIVEKRQDKNDPVYILGKAFKPETNIVTGSPAVLLQNILKDRLIESTAYDPYIDEEKPEFKPGVYFVGTQHEIFKAFNFPEGSTVIDPFRYIPGQEGIELISIGG